MRVEFAPEFKIGGKRFCGCVMWETENRFPKRGGRFPTNHPCFVNETGFRAFHDLGYRTGLYAQGDGFMIEWTGRSPAEVARDIEECFGWVVANSMSRTAAPERETA